MKIYTMGLTLVVALTFCLTPLSAETKKKPTSPPAKKEAISPSEEPEKASKADKDAPMEITTPSGLKMTDLVVGTGSEAIKGATVEVHYTGTLEDGEVFDSSHRRNKTFSFPLGAGRVIEGWDEGVQGMKEGGKRKLVIPSKLAYGPEGIPGTIPPAATLTFEVELVKVR